MVHMCACQKATWLHLVNKYNDADKHNNRNIQVVHVISEKFEDISDMKLTILSMLHHSMASYHD